MCVSLCKCVSYDGLACRPGCTPALGPVQPGIGSFTPPPATLIRNQEQGLEECTDVTA